MDKKTEFYTEQVVNLFKNRGYKFTKLDDDEGPDFEIRHKDDKSIYFLSVCGDLAENF